MLLRIKDQDNDVDSTPMMRRVRACVHTFGATTCSTGRDLRGAWGCKGFFLGLRRMARTVQHANTSLLALFAAVLGYWLS